MSEKNAIEKAKDALLPAARKMREVLNVLENVIPKTYDPQEPCDIEDVLTTVLSRVDLARGLLKTALETQKPAKFEDLSDTVSFEDPEASAGYKDRMESYRSACKEIDELEAEKPIGVVRRDGCELAREAVKTIDDYLDMGCFKNPELVRSAMLEGFEFGYRNAEAFNAQPAANDTEKAYQVLEVYGVSRERAKTLANGIDVLATRFRKEINATNAEFAALTFIPSGREHEIACSYAACDWGQGLGGMGRCSGHGNPRDPHCPRFTTEASDYKGPDTENILPPACTNLYFEQCHARNGTLCMNGVQCTPVNPADAPDAENQPIPEEEPTGCGLPCSVDEAVERLKVMANHDIRKPTDA